MTIYWNIGLSRTTGTLLLQRVAIQEFFTKGEPDVLLGLNHSDPVCCRRPSVASDRKQKQIRRFTFEELKKREFLDQVCLLLTVWPGLHVVCILLDKYGSRTSHAADLPTNSDCSRFKEPVETQHVYIHITLCAQTSDNRSSRRWAGWTSWAHKKASAFISHLHSSIYRNVFLAAVWVHFYYQQMFGIYSPFLLMQ